MLILARQRESYAFGMIVGIAMLVCFSTIL
ncbi:hypothetical protein PDIG_77930 [Penicillium digitatum PHI26]|uniref:Uncharacterized protein n=2 Tax=Penicillium digitatum TaxID=36651 RepID=K9FDH6_PEND2|nr:hypothetical protein PDIP_26360 [Penicillium digitatum Pd1]EKV06232.1 hypothetical protein PDIG_77930 [Penicillium digitatum PHI26]EKV18666.1 hypothetical protein PDIP_26360 [Penicillium digitatum Pd1]